MDRSLSFSADSKTLFYDLKGGRLARWDAETRQELASLPVGDEFVSRILFSEDGRFAAATAGWASLTLVWSLPEWKEVYRLTNQEALAISARHDRLATTARQELHTWRLSSGEHLGTQIGHQATLHSAAFSPSEPAIITAGWDNTIRFWRLEAPTPPLDSLALPQTGLPSDADTLAQRPLFSSGGTYWTRIQTNRTFALYSSQPPSLARTYPWGLVKPHSVGASPDGSRIALGGETGELMLLDAASGQVLATNQFSTNAVYSVRFSPDGRRLAVAHWSGGRWEWALEVLDGKNLTRIHHLPNSGLTIKALEFTPDNRYLLSGTYSAKAELFDLRTGQRIQTFSGHDGSVDSISITPDARIVVTYDSSGAKIRLWDARTAEVLSVLHGTWETYLSLALSPDGTRLAAGFEGIDLWDLQTGRHILSWPTPGEWWQAIAWSSDMSRLVTAGDQALRVWPAPTVVAEDPSLNASLRALRDAEGAGFLPKTPPSNPP